MGVHQTEVHRAVDEAALLQSVEVVFVFLGVILDIEYLGLSRIHRR